MNTLREAFRASNPDPVAELTYVKREAGEVAAVYEARVRNPVGRCQQGNKNVEMDNGTLPKRFYMGCKQQS